MAEQPTPDAIRCVRLKAAEAEGPSPWARYVKKHNPYNGSSCDPRIKKPDFNDNDGDDSDPPAPLGVFMTTTGRESIPSTTLGPWYADSGCYPHLCKDKGYFICLEPVQPRKVTAAYGKYVMAEYGGSVAFEAWDANQQRTRLIVLHGVLYVPQLKQNLMSIPMVTERNNKCVFTKKSMTVFDNNN